MDETETETDRRDLLDLTTGIVAAYVGANPVGQTDLPDLIQAVHEKLAALGIEPEAAVPPTPAVPIKKSLTKAHLVCLEDGKKFKSLKRHLMTSHGMTPAEYRIRWGLPHDYPMVAPDYAATRKALAEKIGLGRKAGAKAKPKPKPKRRSKAG